eukprot:611969-Rhodomonas_salina.1
MKLRGTEGREIGTGVSRSIGQRWGGCSLEHSSLWQSRGAGVSRSILASELDRNASDCSSVSVQRTYTCARDTT